MKLADLAEKLQHAKVAGDTGSVEVRDLNHDSRRIQAGDLFCALVGAASDGNRFIPQALGNGAAAVLTDRLDAVPGSVPAIIVPDARVAMAFAAHELFDKPTEALTLIGVTGTNGKTTCTYLLQSILDSAGHRTGLIGTTGWRFGDHEEPLDRTTPEAPDLLRLLAWMRSSGATAAALEVTSIAMPMHRVEGFHFDAGLYTNLSQDHLDLHGTMEKYFAAKHSFFMMLARGVPAVANADDARGLRMLSGIAAAALSYGFEGEADVRGELIAESAAGMTIRVTSDQRQFDVETPCIGRFNASNILGCVAVSLALGLDPEPIRTGISNAPQVRGRMERLQLEGGVTAVIDYAHTPDALERALAALRSMCAGRLIVVIGAGGNRDASKRPLMGQAASAGADLAIITSDNPRFEDPGEIIRQVNAGAGKNAEKVANRREAIARALEIARDGDVILVAGKGHETYQEIAGVKHPFDDRAELLKLRSRAC